MKIKARIQTFNSGSKGRSGEYIAIVKPQLFKSGKMKKTQFEVVEILETTRKEWGAHGCHHSETIAEVLEVIEG